MGIVIGASTLAAISIGASVAAAGVGAYGAIKKGQAEHAAAEYNAQVSQQNAAIARENALIAEQSGEAQASISLQKTRATIASTTAQQAASGVSVNSGSYTDVRSSEREIGELDAMNIRSNAAREAFGYKVKATSEENEAILSKFEGEESEKAGYISAGATLLGGASSAAGKWADWKIAGGGGTIS